MIEDMCLYKPLRASVKEMTVASWITNMCVASGTERRLA